MTVSKRIFVGLISLWLAFFTAIIYADDASLGQTIQIYTNLQSFTGKPSWLLLIRDVDNDQNIPYLYDFSRGDNFWLAFTMGRNYLISESTLHFSPYHYNPYYSKKITNFCNLQSY